MPAPHDPLDSALGLVTEAELDELLDGAARKADEEEQDGDTER